MPSIAHLATWLLVGASLAGCSGARVMSIIPTGNETPVTNQPTAVTPQSQTFSISRGQTITIGLTSAGAGGYEWHLDEGFDTRVVRLKSKRAGELPANAPLGKFADEIFEFEGVAAGQATLSFSQYRSWEGPSRAVETRRYPVTIK
jgi:predicted secreted protein